MTLAINIWQIDSKTFRKKKEEKSKSDFSEFNLKIVWASGDRAGKRSKDFIMQFKSLPIVQDIAL